jgi:hypothetical protein
MRMRILTLSAILLTVFSGTFAQTKCLWLERSENGAIVQKIGVSVRLVKLFARPGGNFDIDGVKITYDTLLTAYKEGSEIRIKDSTGETRIYGGKFNETMNEETERHNYLIVESSDSGKETKINKIRVESLEAVTVLLAMIGSNDIDKDIDRIESALDRGGVLYIRDLKKDSRLWIYVN